MIKYQITFLYFKINCIESDEIKNIYNFLHTNSLFL
jgi:hypothetical protein